MIIVLDNKLIAWFQRPAFDRPIRKTSHTNFTEAVLNTKMK